MSGAGRAEWRDQPDQPDRKDMEVKTCALLALILFTAELGWCLIDRPDPVDSALARSYCSARHR
jgi:hypothetical protein